MNIFTNIQHWIAAALLLLLTGDGYNNSQQLIHVCVCVWQRSCHTWSAHYTQCWSSHRWLTVTCCLFHSVLKPYNLISLSLLFICLFVIMSKSVRCKVWVPDCVSSSCRLQSGDHLPESGSGEHPQRKTRGKTHAHTIQYEVFLILYKTEL